MFSPEITLKEFVEPITTCDQNSPLKTLITQVQSSNHGMVAIIDQKRSPIGVVHSHRLLFLFTKSQEALSFQGRETMTSLIPKDLERSTLSQNQSVFNYQDFITSIPVLFSNIKIKDLSSYLKLHQVATTDYTHYLVVDPNKQLLGVINSNKLIQYLLKETNSQKIAKPKQSLIEENLYKLLDKIPLPITIRSKKGDILYRNLYCDDYRHCPQGDITLNSLLHDSLPQPLLITELSANNTVRNPSLTSYQPSYAELPVTLSDQSRVTKIANKSTFLAEKQELNYLKLPLDFSDDLALDVNSPLRESWLIIGIKSELQIKDNPKIKEKVKNFNSDDLVQLNQLKNEFLLNFGHDLKSPLTAIIGLSRLLQAERLGHLNKRQVDYIDLIYRSGQKLMIIINDLLDMSRVAGEKSKIYLETLVIKDICEEVYQQVLHKLQFNPEINRQNFTSQTSNTLHLTIDPQLPIIVADKVCLIQILTQLLSNALKFTIYQGQFGIKVDDWQQWVAITVWDHGITIPEVKQNLLLGKYIEFTSHDVSKVLDNNLGLIFAQKLARVHGGDISFISTVGQGNKFTLILPQKCQKSQQNYDSDRKSFSAKIPKIVNDDGNFKNLLVLIIETSANRLEYLNNELQKLGYYPVIARTVEEVAYKAINLKPSKIILNSELIKTWNQDIIELLHSQEETSNIPVFAINSVNNPHNQVFSAELTTLPLTLTSDSLMLAFPPVVKKPQPEIQSHQSLTILRLSISSEFERNTSNQNLALDAIFSDRNFTWQHRIIEADSLEQAHILARIWNIDGVIFDGSNLPNPLDYLLAFKELDGLSNLPLITLDAKTTEAANQVNGLTIFPCLVPLNQNNITELIQVIQIATGLK